MRVARLMRLGVLAFLAAASCANPNEPTVRVIELAVTASAEPCSTISAGGGYGYGFGFCINVRELPYGQWEIVNAGAIEGFTFNSAYTYRLLVGVRTIPDPPPSGPDHSYRFIRLLNRSPVPQP